MKRLIILIGILTAVLAAIVAVIILLSSPEEEVITEETVIKEDILKDTLAPSESIADAASENNGIIETDGTESGAEEHVFNEVEMQLIRELIFAKADGKETESILLKLEGLNPGSSDTWREILSYWDETRASGFVNTLEEGGESISMVEGCPVEASHEGTLLPAGLPEDDSLCIVCLGYQLYSDGSMRDELVGRLETVRACAIQYPNAWVILTGGPTAFADKAVTEADAMADWLVQHGIDEERIIVENRSMTSATNALFSYELLSRQYPQVRDVAIVSSDYHVALGSQLFQIQFMLARELGSDTRLNVAANASYHVDMDEMFGSDIEANWIWILVQEQTAEIHNIEGEM